MSVILLTNKYPSGPREIVESVIPEGFELLMLDEVTQEDLLCKAPKADYILASGRLKINKDVIDAAKNLKMIQRTGVGLDSIDLELLKEREIPLYVNQGVNSESVAEHTILLILACLRRLTEINDNTRAGRWIKQAQGVKTRELKGKTLGIIGMGNIGQKVAKLANAFDANVVCHSYPPLTQDQEREWHVKQIPLKQLLKTSDIISLHCPLVSDTKEIIRKENLDKMKDGVIIVNTARGALINEKDLVEALDNGKVTFAGIDVFPTEPPSESAMPSHPLIIATPHIAGVTYDSFRQMMSQAMDNIYAFEKGDLEYISKSKMA